MAAKTWEIKDTTGTVLHAAAGKTRRAVIEALVAKGQSLAGADLEKADLSNLNLSGADLTGARLEGADLRGTNLHGAVLRQANLRGARLHGARLHGARCEGADLTEAQLSGARLTFANLRGATLDDADLTRTSASSCVFTHVTAHRTNFAGAGLTNSDFGNSTVVDADFSGARLGHRIFGSAAPELAQALERNLPNRTRGAVIVGCTYDDKTEFAATVPAMRSDLRVSRLTRFGLWAASTLGVVLASDGVTDLLAGTSLASGLGTGPSFLAVVGAMYLVKEGLGDLAKDKVAEGMNFLTRKVREAMNNLERHGANRLHLVCAMARDFSLDPLRRALEAKAPDARQHGFFGGLASFMHGLGQVIVCDRRHLALALGALSANRKRAYALPRDIVLVRHDRAADASDPSPMVIGFLKDGRTTAVWPLASGGHATVLYDANNAYSGCWDAAGVPADPAALGLPAVHAAGLEAVFAFEAGLLRDHAIEGFAYPHDSHYLQAGRDGTVFVHRGADRRLDNPVPGSPAMILPDGSGYCVRNGGIVGEWAPAAAPPGP